MSEAHLPSFQRRLTVLFVVGYFMMVFVFLALGAALFFVGATFTDDTREVMVWLQGTLGPLIGVLTGSLKDQLQYHYGSSVGSKMKTTGE